MPVLEIAKATRSSTSGEAGVGASALDAEAGDVVANDGNTIILVSNGGLGAVTVKVAIQAAVDGVTPAAKSFVIGAGANYIPLGPFPPAIYNNPDGNLELSYTGETNGLFLLPVRF